MHLSRLYQQIIFFLFREASKYYCKAITNNFIRIEEITAIIVVGILPYTVIKKTKNTWRRWKFKFHWLLCILLPLYCMIGESGSSYTVKETSGNLNAKKKTFWYHTLNHSSDFDPGQPPVVTAGKFHSTTCLIMKLFHKIQKLHESKHLKIWMFLIAVYPSLLWPEVKIRTNKNICWYSSFEFDFSNIH